jgi:hypothetical protein
MDAARNPAGDMFLDIALPGVSDIEILRHCAPADGRTSPRRGDAID